MASQMSSTRRMTYETAERKLKAAGIHFTELRFVNGAWLLERYGRVAKTIARLEAAGFVVSGAAQDYLDEFPYVTANIALPSKSDDLNPEPTPGDSLPLDASDAPVVEYIGIGDKVTAHGQNGIDYTGHVVMTDPVQGVALVTVWDEEVDTPYTAWWPVEWLDLVKAVDTATASAAAEAV